MINGKTVLALIPARGGSKGVVRKNVRDLAGKPLIAWTIEAAKKSIYIDRLILSSDNSEIIEVARHWGCEVPFIRPKELAQDNTPGIEPVLHAINNLPHYDYVVLLQPTSPLRLVDDIDACIELCLSRQANACVSVTEPDKSPYWMFELDHHNKMHPILKTERSIARRQDMPAIVALNGSVYMANCEWLLENRTFLTADTIAFNMPKERSIDIDTELDLRICDYLLTNY